MQTSVGRTAIYGCPLASAKQICVPPAISRKRFDAVCYTRHSSSTTTTYTSTRQQGGNRHLSNTPNDGKPGVANRFKMPQNVLSATRSVKFHVRYRTDFGQEVYLVGNCSALGNWDVMQGVRLTWNTGHIWEGSVELPAGMHIQYKYVVRNNDGSVVRWQEGANVSLELPGGPADALALDVEDSWNKSKQVKRILATGTPVRFNIRFKVEFGQSLLVVGSCAVLGNWNVDNSVRLNWQEGHIWEGSVELPAGEMIQYKYIVRNSDGSIDCWQPGDNLQMEVPLAQGVSGRRRGVLVLDTWTKPGKTAKRPTYRSPATAPWAPGSCAYPTNSPSWRSTPYSSTPAGPSTHSSAYSSAYSSTNGNGMAIHTDSPRFGSSPAANSNGVDIDDASSAMAASSYYSMMATLGVHTSNGNGGSSAGLAGSANILDSIPQHQNDPNVMQHWTDKPRFGSSNGGSSGVQQHQAHQDPWGQAKHKPRQELEDIPRVHVPPPRVGASAEEYARWQALQSVMAALQHSAELDHWVDDPTDPRMLAADRRLAALTASLGGGVGAAAAVV